MKLAALTDSIIAAAIEVHKELGPGLLESTYEACLAYELARAGHDVVRQLQLPVTYKGMRLRVAYRIDLLVDGLVIIEIKATAKLEPLHEAQLLSYLRLSEREVGLLFNFNVTRLKDGIKRVIRDAPKAA